MSEEAPKANVRMSDTAAKDLAASLREDKSTVADIQKPVAEAHEEPKPEPKKAEPPAKKDEDEDLTGIEGLHHDKKTNKQFVPTDVFVGERRKLKAQLKAEQEGRAKFEADANQRLKDVMELARGMKPEAAPKAEEAKPAGNPHNYDTHPFEHLKWETDSARQRAEAAEKRVADFQGSTEQERQLMTAVSSYQHHHRSFAEKNPHYPDAYMRVIGTWVNEFKAQGYSEAEANVQANRREWALAQRAAQAGTSPQEQLLTIAKSFGWTPPKADGLDTSRDGQDAAAQAKREKDSLTRLKEASEVSGSLSDLTGGAAQPELSLKTIMGMDQDEWRGWMADPDNAKKFNKLLRKAG